MRQLQHKLLPTHGAAVGMSYNPSMSHININPNDNMPQQQYQTPYPNANSMQSQPQSYYASGNTVHQPLRQQQGHIEITYQSQASSGT